MVFPFRPLHPFFASKIIVTPDFQSIFNLPEPVMTFLGYVKVTSRICIATIFLLFSKYSNLLLIFPGTNTVVIIHV